MPTVSIAVQGNLPIPLGWRGEDVEMRRPSHHHDVMDQEGKGRHLVLRDIGDPFGHFGRPHAGDILVAEKYGAVPALENIGHALEERGLSGAVGAQQAENIAGINRKGYLAENGQGRVAGIAEGQVLYG